MPSSYGGVQARVGVMFFGEADEATPHLLPQIGLAHFVRILPNNLPLVDL